MKLIITYSFSAGYFLFLGLLDPVTNSGHLSRISALDFGMALFASLAAITTAIREAKNK